jgi:hypothetical protein
LAIPKRFPRKLQKYPTFFLRHSGSFRFPLA